MEEEHVRNLLRRSEGDTLDFKRDQYPFAGATDEEKSELLKDILAFANAWKESDAYIVIGVSEVDGRALSVPGTTHLQDADIQQFVVSKTNRPVLFEVESVDYNGVVLSIIRIRQKQDRPIFLKKRYGRLESGVVYVRRGSSTDKADPQEIAEMGRDASQQAVAEKAADVTVELEHALETWEDRDHFGGVGMMGRKREPYDVDLLKIRLRNVGASVAHFIKGDIVLPKDLLFDHARKPFKLPTSTEKLDWSSFTFSNKLSPSRTNIWAAPLPAEWVPILPNEVLQVRQFRTFPLKFLQAFVAEVRWKAQADASPVRTGTVRYMDILISDKRRSKPA